MFRLPVERIETLLCIGCHSDDIEIGCGGLVLRLLRERPSLKVHWVVLGATGERDTEAQRSAEAWLGSACDADVVIRPFRDSYFPTQWAEIKEFLHGLSARVQPDLILTHRRDDAHQDHRVAAELTWCAFRDHLILEYEIPKYEGDLGRPNVYASLPADVAQRKIALLMEHFTTQRGKDWFRPETFEALMRLRGIECKAAGGYAEGFYARKLTV